MPIFIDILYEWVGGWWVGETGCQKTIGLQNQYNQVKLWGVLEGTLLTLYYCITSRQTVKQIH